MPAIAEYPIIVPTQIVAPLIKDAFTGLKNKSALKKVAEAQATETKALENAQKLDIPDGLPLIDKIKLKVNSNKYAESMVKEVNELEAKAKADGEKFLNKFMKSKKNYKVDIQDNYYNTEYYCNNFGRLQYVRETNEKGITTIAKVNHSKYRLYDGAYYNSGSNGIEWEIKLKDNKLISLKKQGQTAFKENLSSRTINGKYQKFNDGTITKTFYGNDYNNITLKYKPDGTLEINR